MAQNGIIAGLDIGTSSIKNLIVSREQTKDGETVLELVGNTQVASDGVRRGTVVNTEKVSNISRDLFLKTEQDFGHRIDSVYVNLGGSHIFSLPSRGLVSVSRADQKISQEDVNRVLNEAKAINLSSNKYIFDVFPKEYIIDGVSGIKEARGLEGVRLEVEALAVGGFGPYFDNLGQAVSNSGLEVAEMIPSAIAAAKATLDEKQKELGVAILDIGAGISSLAVFEEGSLIHLAVLPMGSVNITKDIAIGLKTDFEIAEKIKIGYGACSSKGKDVKRKMSLGGGEHIVFTQRFLTNIISSRISEILDEANKELKKVSKEKLLPAGIVLTGGGVKLPRIVDLAKDRLKLPVRLGRPQGINGLEPDPSLATVCGLVLAGAEGEQDLSGGVSGKILSRLKKVFRIFIP